MVTTESALQKLHLAKSTARVSRMTTTLTCPWIFGFALDLRSDVVSKDRSTRFIDLIGRYDHTHLAACLDRMSLLNTIIGICDLFELLKALDVGFKVLLARAWAWQ